MPLLLESIKSGDLPFTGRPKRRGHNRHHHGAGPDKGVNRFKGSDWDKLFSIQTADVLPTVLGISPVIVDVG